MASAPSVWSNKRQGAIIDVQLGASLMNTRLIRFALGIAGILSLGTPVCAQAADEAKQLELRYRGVPSRVRDLVSDSKIRYDTRGKLIGKWHRDNGHGTAPFKLQTLKPRECFSGSRRIDFCSTTTEELTSLLH